MSSCILDWDEKVFSPRSVFPQDSYRKLLLVLEICIAISVFVLTKIAMILIPFVPCLQSLPLLPYQMSSGFIQIFFKKSRSLSCYLLTSLSPFLSASSPNHLAWCQKLFILFQSCAAFFTCLFPVPKKPWSWGLNCGYTKSYGGKPGI